MHASLISNNMQNSLGLNFIFKNMLTGKYFVSKKFLRVFKFKNKLDFLSSYFYKKKRQCPMSFPPRKKVLLGLFFKYSSKLGSSNEFIL